MIAIIPIDGLYGYKYKVRTYANNHLCIDFAETFREALFVAFDNIQDSFKRQ